ncbi:MAG: UDP-N-acetylmuramate dehydrogenase [Planctomycetota bacterium]|jgi:UDP-N-acetylmuramate dehydrogenase
MKQQVEKNKILAPLTTLSLGGEAGGYVLIQSLADLHELISAIQDVPGKQLVILGGGSNIVLPDNAKDLFVVHIHMMGRHVEENDTRVLVTLGAGEDWDEIVGWCVASGYAGVEALSGIPGSVGGAVVQNIGAYGSEAEETIVSVEVFDLLEKRRKVFSHDECNFMYRESVFKKQPELRYLVLGCVLALRRMSPGDLALPEYRGVTEMFEQLGHAEITLATIRDTIVALRNSKLPHPNIIPNVGSFFKNPIISQDQFTPIREQYPAIPHWEVDGGVKLSAGWLIEELGFKGQWFGGIQVSPLHALVLTNPDKTATSDDLQEARQAIQNTIQEKFAIALEAEPVIIE